MGALQVLHTISLNCPYEVCKQMADGRLLRLLERSYLGSACSAVKGAIVQLLIDWRFLFR